MAATDVDDAAGLRGFLNRGGFWRLLLLVVVYLAIYLGAGWISGHIGGHFVDDDVLSSPGSVFFQFTLALIVGAIVLTVLTAYLGWNRDLFGRQPIYRSWWMWIAPLVVLAPIMLRVFGIDWGRDAVDVVALVLATGLLIGYVEELLTRGIGVKMLRAGGHGEWVVAALSSLVFALLHSINLLSGQEVTTVAFTIVYAFAFGVLMYLSQRVIGFLVGAMILHGLTDPTTILAVGGVDELKTSGHGSGLLDAAGLVTFPLIALGFILLIFIRGRVSPSLVEEPGTAGPKTTSVQG